MCESNIMSDRQADTLFLPVPMASTAPHFLVNAEAVLGPSSWCEVSAALLTSVL